MPGLHEREVVQLLLVRAVEEEAPELFPPEVVADAALAALDARDDRELLEKRSAYLSLRLPRAFKGLAHMAFLPEDRLGSWLAVAVLAGMLSNYVGPSGLVHVAYNPLTFLLLWNLIVFAALATRRLRRRSADASALPTGAERAAATTDGEAATEVGEAAAHVGEATARVEGGSASARRDDATATTHSAPRRSSVGLAPRARRMFFADLYVRWVSWRTRVDGARENVRGGAAVASSFSRAYWEAAGAVIVARLEALVHVAAVGVLAGALAGTYLRGLFFEYNAVWRSTFLVEPSSIATFLNLLLAPGLLLFDGRLLDASAIAPLLGVAGEPAGAWIHRLALTTALLIVPVRFTLALRAARRARAAAMEIRVDFSDPYYVERIAAVREGVGHRLREQISTMLRLEVGKLAESVALFVCERFFDKTVAPILVGYRNRGGTVRELEEELATGTARFEPALAEHLRLAQRDLQQALASGVRAAIGRELRPASDSLARDTPTMLALDQRLASSVATGVGDALGVAVTATATATAATLSGGVGESLGIAVLSSLLGTSGPVGLLIGGVAALAVVGGAYALGRERVAAAVKKWPIPASVASLALRDSRIEAARRQTHAQVKREVGERLEGRIPEVTEAILRELPLVVTGTPRGS